MNLLVGIDTEGDNQWDAHARAHQKFENIYALPRLHALFARHGVRPTYVITYPVAKDARSADVLRALLSGGDCEIGAHHHAWVRPVTYRSGRFGFSAEHVAGLERLGYLVESSVAPLFYESHKGGPEFVEAPLTPYFLAYDSATSPGSSGVLEVPVSCGLNRRLPRRLQYAYARAPRPYMTKRLLRALGLIRLNWLRPSYSSLPEMVALARSLARAHEPVLNLLFHSSEAIAGGSPYNTTPGELDAFFERLERFLEFATRELNAAPATFAEFRRAYAG